MRFICSRKLDVPDRQDRLVWWMAKNTSISPWPNRSLSVLTKLLDKQTSSSCSLSRQGFFIVSLNIDSHPTDFWTSHSPALIVFHTFSSLMEFNTSSFAQALPHFTDRSSSIDTSHFDPLDRLLCIAKAYHHQTTFHHWKAKTLFRRLFSADCPSTRQLNQRSRTTKIISPSVFDDRIRTETKCIDRHFSRLTPLLVIEMHEWKQQRRSWLIGQKTMRDDEWPYDYSHLIMHTESIQLSHHHNR